MNMLDLHLIGSMGAYAKDIIDTVQTFNTSPSPSGFPFPPVLAISLNDFLYSNLGKTFKIENVKIVGVSHQMEPYKIGFDLEKLKNYIEGE